MNDRLTGALNNLSTMRKERGGVKAEDCCGFCGQEYGDDLFRGPIVAICEECAIIACGLFLISSRDGLSMKRDAVKIWERGLREYSLRERREAMIKSVMPSP